MAALKNSREGFPRGQNGPSEVGEESVRGVGQGLGAMSSTARPERAPRG